MEITKIDHIAIQTNNFNESLKFYSEILGFQVLKGPIHFKKRMLCFLDAGNIKIELYSIKNNQKPANNFNNCRAGLVHLSLVVQDIYGSLQELSENGVTIIKQPFIPPSGDPNQPLISYIEGPDGQEIEIREQE